MASLKDEHRCFIIDQLACFGTLDEIEKGLKEVFQIDVPKSTILRYDPTTVQGSQELGEKWKLLFAARRKTFLDDVSTIPVATQAGRLRMLNDIARQAKNKGNLKMALVAMEQAAKDMGGMFMRQPAKPGSSDPGEGNGNTSDADAEAAERSTRVDALVDSARARRDRDAAAQGTEGADAAPNAAG